MRSPITAALVRRVVSAAFVRRKQDGGPHLRITQGQKRAIVEGRHGIR